MENNEYPAVLVLSAIRTDPRTDERRIVVFADNKVLDNEDDANLRCSFYDTLKMRGGLPYDYSLVGVDRVEEIVAEIRAELEAELNGTPAPEPETNDKAGDADTPPAPEDPPAKEEPRDNDTTTGPARQIVMVVRYQGTGVSVTPTGPWAGATCELVRWEDGRDNIPPDDNPKRLRDLLALQGYLPEFREWHWLDKGHGPRRRREVYRYNGATEPYDETIDANFLREMYEDLKPDQLPEAERAALYKAKALAGEGPFPEELPPWFDDHDRELVIRFVEPDEEVGNES